MTYCNTRITPVNTDGTEITAVTGSATVTLWNSVTNFNPLQHSNVQWFVFYIEVDANTDNSLVLQYSMDKGENWTAFSTTAITNASANEGEVYIGHFEHVRAQFTAGSSDVDDFVANINIHAGDRSPIGI